MAIFIADKTDNMMTKISELFVKVLWGSISKNQKIFIFIKPGKTSNTLYLATKKLAKKKATAMVKNKIAGFFENIFK